MSSNSSPPLTTDPPHLATLAALPADELTHVLGRDAGHTAQWMYQAACEGLVEAQTVLGQMLLDGRGTPADAGAARRWFARAAAAGHPPAANMLGRCFERGWGGAVDMGQAAHWYGIAAAAGLDWGQYNLANMLLRGRGVPRDVAASFHWFATAADAGHAKSMNLVGRFLEEGWAGPADPAAAAAWYRRAAEGGDFRGQYNLAVMLTEAGRVADAVTWFSAAGDGGSLDFRRMAAEALLDRPEPALRHIGLRIAARCCRDGDAGDFHRYGMALLHGPQPRPRVAKYWLGRAQSAGDAASRVVLAEMAAAIPTHERSGLVRRLLGQGS